MANMAKEVQGTVQSSRQVSSRPQRPSLHLPFFKILVYFFVTLGAFLFVMPFVWMLTTSLMTSSEIARGGYLPHSRLFKFSAVSEEDWGRKLGEFLPPTTDIRFQGNAVTLYYYAHPDGGTFDVLIDGQLAASVNSYSPDVQANQEVLVDAYPSTPTLSMTQQIHLADTNHVLQLAFNESSQRGDTIWFDRIVSRNEDGEEDTVYANDFTMRWGKWESGLYENGEWEAVEAGDLGIKATNLGFPEYLQACCRAVISRSTRFQGQNLSEYIRLERPSGSHSSLTTDFLPLGLNKALGLSERYVVTGSFSHYVKVWNDSNFAKFFINSVVITFLTVSFQTLFALTAAYAFARMQFPGRELLFFMFLMTLFVPFMVTLVPNLLTVTSIDRWSLKHIGPIFEKIGDFTGTIPILGKPKAAWSRWIDNLPGLVVPFWASTFSIFLLRQFFMQIPMDLWDAARIDGAGHMRFLFQIVVPISKAAITTVVLFSFIGTWDQLDWPLLVTTSEKWRPIAYALYDFRNDEGDNPQLLMAGAMIALLPVIIAYLLAQRQFTEGIATTGLKG